MRKLFVACILLAMLAPGCKKNARPDAGLAVTYQVGVFANPENARGLKDSLSSMGYDVAIEKFTDNGVSYERVLVSHSGPLEFIYQVGAFANEDNAKRLRETLAAEGYDANVRKVSINDATYYRVYVHNKNSQEAFSIKMRAMGLGEPVFRSLKTY